MTSFIDLEEQNTLQNWTFSRDTIKYGSSLKIVTEDGVPHWRTGKWPLPFRMEGNAIWT